MSDTTRTWSIEQSPIENPASMDDATTKRNTALYHALAYEVSMLMGVSSAFRHNPHQFQAAPDSNWILTSMLIESCIVHLRNVLGFAMLDADGERVGAITGSSLGFDVAAARVALWPIATPQLASGMALLGSVDSATGLGYRVPPVTEHQLTYEKLHYLCETVLREVIKIPDLPETFRIGGVQHRLYKLA